MTSQALFDQKFREVESLIKLQTHTSKEDTFTNALKLASRQNSYVNQHALQLKDYADLRNLLSHRDTKEYIANIKKFLLDEMDVIISNIKNPPTVLDHFRRNNPKAEVYQVQADHDIFSVMSRMDEKTYTHVPVWKKDKLIGVFSYSSFFSWLFERQKISKDDVTFSKNFMNDIDPKYLNSPTVNLRLIRESMSIHEVPPIFDGAVKRSQRLDCLLITRNGQKHEPITGIITPWDLADIA